MYKGSAIQLLISSLLIGACVFAITTQANHSLETPARVGVINHQNLAALPQALVPALDQVLARNLPDTWQAIRTAQGAQLTNPNQYLSVSLDNRGLHLISNGHNGVTMQLIDYMQGMQHAALQQNATPQLHNTQASLNHGAGLTEWYLNSPIGIEQGFTMAHPLNSASSVVLTFTLQSSMADVLKNNVLEFYNRGGKSVLHYGELLAYDARHQPLPAYLTLVDERLSVIVDTRGASYPVTVDPLFTTTFPTR